MTPPLGYGSHFRVTGCRVWHRLSTAAYFRFVNILIADDNALLRKVLRQTIDSHPGLAVCCEAEDGTDAVEKATHYKPDLVLLDLAMPQMNGLTAASIISESLPDTPIFLFTLYGSLVTEEQARRAGVQRVISKSEPHTLIPAIEELFGQRAMRS